MTGTDIFAQVAKPPGLDASLGALLIGIILGQCLYGALCVQVFCYYQHNFKNDPLYIKFMVTSSCIIFHFLICGKRLLETVHTVFLCVTLYQTAVTHYGEVDYLAIAPWPMIYSVLVTGLVETPVQIFFAYRVYALSKWRIIPSITIIAAVACLGITITDSIRASKIKFQVEFQDSSLALIATALAMGVAVDVSNTVCLVWILVQSKGPVNRTRQMVDTLVVWTIERGKRTIIHIPFLLCASTHLDWSHHVCS
ncbi:hypothetical protein K435DRAFT_765929 [Dendrothele bispora CBS 962.96]|uniref:Uncharacterized protein n=1 Tax=Dendrothele bispora (strain CBS 962.96) TaxID=1314807 RepID=A0A4S8L433_DENBC|nr:hypothetical protein K435DRAFT_765929 [Dendrothele bispora CBS 962.96]